MRCIVVKPILRAGRVVPVGEEIELSVEKYEQLHASGHVGIPAGPASTAPDQSADAEHALTADAEHTADADPTGSGAQRRPRRQR